MQILNKETAHISSISGRCQLAEKFNIVRIQVSSILKRKTEYLTAYEKNQRGDRKRHCYSNESNVLDIACGTGFNMLVDRNSEIPL